jgi:carbon storage regulator
MRDEDIVIGDDVVVRILDIRGDKVRLGITAPSNVAVHRREVYEAIKREAAQLGRAPVRECGPQPGSCIPDVTA